MDLVPSPLLKAGFCCANSSRCVETQTSSDQKSVPAKKPLRFHPRLRETFPQMKAVILAAGKGTRMKELTNDVPKPMLKVQGVPILEHIILGLKAAGIHE